MGVCLFVCLFFLQISGVFVFVFLANDRVGEVSFLSLFQKLPTPLKSNGAFFTQQEPFHFSNIIVIMKFWRVWSMMQCDVKYNITISFHNIFSLSIC